MLIPETGGAEIVAEMEESFQRARQRVLRVQQARVAEDIGPRLGQVTVTGYGHLVSITVDRDAFQTVSPDVLGKKVVEAVNRAESKAERLRTKFMADGSTH